MMVKMVVNNIDPLSEKAASLRLSKEHNRVRLAGADAGVSFGPISSLDSGHKIQKPGKFPAFVPLNYPKP